MIRAIQLSAIIGLILHLPLLGLTIHFGWLSKPSGPHAGTAALALALPFLISVGVAVIGGLCVLGAAIWSRLADPHKVAGLGWITWSCGAIALLWVILGLVVLIRRSG
jgi:hypothetical protein